MDLLKLIKKRRTIRKYKHSKISQKIIRDIIDAARWAPSAHNLQPWKFIAISDKKKISAIADFLQQEANVLLSGFNIVMRDTSENLR